MYIYILAIILVILICKHIQFYTFYNKALKLWDDHFYWTRLFIVLSLRNAVGLDDRNFRRAENSGECHINGIPETTARLLQNAVDFGNLYGSKKLEVAITEHLTIAAGIVESVKNTGKPDPNLLSQWHENAELCGSIFFDLNGLYTKLFGDRKKFQGMMLEHLALTSEELMSEYRCIGSVNNDKNSSPQQQSVPTSQLRAASQSGDASQSGAASQCQQSIFNGDNALHEIRMMAYIFTPY